MGSFERVFALTNEMLTNKRYSSYEVDDFLGDEFFVKWVNSPDPHLDKFWKEWLEHNEHKRSMVLYARELILSLKYNEEFELTSKEYTSLYEDIIRSPRVNFRKNRYRTTIQIAASLALIICSVFLLTKFYGKQDNAQPLAKQQTILFKSTAPGQKLTFELPDKSLVKLNASSTLKYWESPDGSSRNVYLEGEGFFEVFKNPDRPFTVNTSELSTTALGTSFNIQAYSDEKKHAFSLLSGSIGIRKISKNSNTPSHILIPGEQLILNRNSNETTLSRFDPDKILAWKNDILLFEDTDLDVVLSKLENWYGVRIVVTNQNEKPQKLFSGRFQNENLERVLEIISFSGGFEFNLKDKNVFIKYSEKN